MVPCDRLLSSQNRLKIHPNVNERDCCLTFCCVVITSNYSVTVINSIKSLLVSVKTFILDKPYSEWGKGETKRKKFSVRKDCLIEYVLVVGILRGVNHMCSILINTCTSYASDTEYDDGPSRSSVGIIFRLFPRSLPIQQLPQAQADNTLIRLLQRCIK